MIDNEKSKKELGNSEEYFKEMLKEISWKNLSQFIFKKKSLMNEFGKGGFQLLPKNKDRAIEIICKKHEKLDCQELFRMWYVNENCYSSLLDKYFSSAAYKKYAKKNKVKDGKCIISESKLDELSSLLTKKHAFFFLHFSPVRFKKDQIDKLVKLSSIDKDSGNLKTEAADDKIFKTLDFENKNLKKTIDRLARKEKRISAESRKHLDELKVLRKNVEELRDALDLQAKEGANNLFEKQKESNEARICAEKSRGEYKAKFEKSEKILKNQLQKINTLKNKIEALKKPVYYHKILKYLDWNILVSSLNEPDEVKELLETLVKLPTADGEPSLPEEDSLKNFWLTHIDNEKHIFDKITEIDVVSVVKGTYFKNWGEHADDFVDLKHSLRARVVMVNALYEILRGQLSKKSNTGHIIEYYPTKSYAFIKCNDSHSYYVHRNSFLNQEEWTQLRNGSTVSFDIGKNDRGPCAVDVFVI